MNKKELARVIQSQENLTRAQAEALVNIFFDQMSEALGKGHRVEIRGFCSFHVKTYNGYEGRNPKTGKKVKVKPKRLPFFKCGRELSARVDEREE